MACQWGEEDLAKVRAAVERVGRGESLWPFERFTLWADLGRYSYTQIDDKASEIMRDLERATEGV